MHACRAVRQNHQQQQQQLEDGKEEDCKQQPAYDVIMETSVCPLVQYLTCIHPNLAFNCKIVAHKFRHSLKNLHDTQHLGTSVCMCVCVCVWPSVAVAAQIALVRLRCNRVIQQHTYT